MRMLRHLFAWFVCLHLVAASGCDETPPAAPTQAPVAEAPAPAVPAALTVEQLPKLGDPLPLLDNGRLEVAPPVEWVVPPREAKWMARFVRYNGSPYPSIFVHAEDHPSFAEMQQDLVWKLVDEVQAALDKEIDPNKDGKKVPQVAPAAIGKYLGAEYLRPAKTKTTQLERLFLITVAGGRKYTVELQCLEGTLEKYRADAVAVAHGLKFHKPNDAQSPASPNP